MKLKLVFLASLCACSALAADTFDQTYDFQSGQALTVKLEPGGNLTVIGEQREGVRVTYPITGSNQNFVLQADQRTDGLQLNGRVEGSDRRFSLHMTLRVPNDLDLNLHTSGGNLEISDIHGDFDFHTMGGNVQMEGLDGRIQLETMGGNIAVGTSRLQGSVKTMGGNISLDKTQGLVSCETMGGNISVDNKGTMDDPQFGADPIRVKTMGGNISVDEAPGGIDAKTMGGNVYVGYARSADLDTYGGNITIAEVHGAATAITKGGDIEVTMVEAPDADNCDVRLESKGGDIILRLPSDFSAEFDVEIKQTKQSKRDYVIESDFDLETRTGGSFTKTISASGQSLTARHKVKLRTINGDIKIHRLH